MAKVSKVGVDPRFCRAKSHELVMAHSGAQNAVHYLWTADPVEAVICSQYFLSVHKQLKTGDLIKVICRPPNQEPALLQLMVGRKLMDKHDQSCTNLEVFSIDDMHQEKIPVPDRDGVSVTARFAGKNGGPRIPTEPKAKLTK